MTNLSYFFFVSVFLEEDLGVADAFTEVFLWDLGASSFALACFLALGVSSGSFIFHYRSGLSLLHLALFALPTDEIDQQTCELLTMSAAYTNAFLGAIFELVNLGAFDMIHHCDFDEYVTNRGGADKHISRRIGDPVWVILIFAIVRYSVTASAWASASAAPAPPRPSRSATFLPRRCETERGLVCSFSASKVARIML